MRHSPDSDFTRTFQIFIEDDRYSVPNLYLVSVLGETRAREIAERLLGESEHHLTAEICEDGQRLFSVGTVDRASPPPAPQAEQPEG